MSGLPPVSTRPPAIATRPPLVDRFDRTITYARISVTDRCNLRCAYCMPEQMTFLPREAILTYEEIERLAGLLTAMGIGKVRITGGEPFVRKDLVPFMERLASLPGLHSLHLTTNGVATAPHLPRLKALGLAGINLSLDTLDPRRFAAITRREGFDRVLATFHGALESGIPLKVNAVVMEAHNIPDIVPMAELTRDHPVAVRFIEEMPFNGDGRGRSRLTWNHTRIRDHLAARFPGMTALDDRPGETASEFTIPGHRGTVGIIAGFTRTFCGTCNRIRINARGQLQTCLYGAPALDLRALLRGGADDAAIAAALRAAVAGRHRTGWDAEKAAGSVGTSMSAIGG